MDKTIVNELINGISARPMTPALLVIFFSIGLLLGFIIGHFS